MATAGQSGDTLTFRCPLSGQPFDSGFDPAKMGLAPRSATLRVRCRACGHWHTFRVADAVAAVPEALPAREPEELTLSAAVAAIRGRGK